MASVMPDDDAEVTWTTSDALLSDDVSAGPAVAAAVAAVQLGSGTDDDDDEDATMCTS